MLILLPQSYTKTFGFELDEPSAKLMLAYKNFEGRLPVQDEDIRNQKNLLAQAVKDCIEAGSIEFNEEN